MSAATTPSRTARERLALPAAILGVTTLFAVVYVLRMGVSAAERGAPFDWGRELTLEIVYWWASLPFVPVLAWLVRRWPVTRERWAPHGLVLLAGTLAVSAARVLINPPLAVLLDEPLVPALHPTRVLGAFSAFLAVVGMLHALHFYRQMREREREATELARSLAEAQLATSEARLASLRAQLQPHFLFNTLNAIAALLHHEPYTADRMLSRLAELLRSALRAPAAEEHALREELAILDQYLDVMALRFGPRLGIERAIDHRALGAAVPWLVLQPLVENALEHGLWPRSGPGVLRIEAARDGGRLRLVVEDDGVGIRPGTDDASSGIGLANTRRRLAHLYGDDASLVVKPRGGGGTRATVVLPVREMAGEPRGAVRVSTADAPAVQPEVERVHG